MWYVPFLRVRRAVKVYACFVVGIMLLALALRLWPGTVVGNGMQSPELALVRIDIAALIAGSAAIVGGLATVLGLNLAAENDGHLEVAWTKPISREGYALGVFAVDIAAMAVCIVGTVACAGIVVDVYFGHQAIALVSGETLERALAVCGFPLCVYGWVTALSASLARNRGMISGIFWPAMLTLAALSLIGLPAVHAVAGFLNAFNPVVIYTIGGGTQSSLWTYGWGWALGALLLAAALVQWRRLEV